MATLLMRPTDGGGSADKKRRSRKTKNTQKKLPQRGLGVAQLEKLRLQEQSLLCPQPSYALRLCAPADHPMTRCDNDVAQTILAFTNLHAAGGSSSGGARGGETGGVSRLTLSPSFVQNMNHSSVESLDAKRAIASRAVPCLNQQSPKFASCNESFFSNVLATTQLHLFDSQAQTHHAQRMEERRAGEAGTTPTYIFPITSNVKEAANHAIDAGFIPHPVYKAHTVQRIPFNASDAPYLETLIGPNVPRQPRQRIELPVVSGRKRPWLAVQETPRHLAQGQALDLNTPAGDSDGMWYNCTDRQSPHLSDGPENRSGAHYTTGIVRNALGNSSCLPMAKAKSVCSSGSPSSWPDSCDSFSVNNCISDVCTGNRIVVRQGVSPSSIKDRCSTAKGSTTCFNLNRKRSPNDLHIPSPVEKEAIHRNFLTLGLSNSLFPSSQTCAEPEDSTHDNNSPMTASNDGSTLKAGSAEGDDYAYASHSRKSARQERPCIESHDGERGYALRPVEPLQKMIGWLKFQIASIRPIDGSTPETGGVDLEGSQCLSMDCYGGTNRSSETIFPSLHSNWFPNSRTLGSNTIIHDDQSLSLQYPKSPRPAATVEAILDLRLKLAL